MGDNFNISKALRNGFEVNIGHKTLRYGMNVQPNGLWRAVS